MLSLLLFLAIGVSNAEPLKVLLIDAGVDQSYTTKLCKDGHKSFVSESWKKDITVKHGTIVTSIIQKYAGEGDYCITHYKIFSEGEGSISGSISALNEALEHNFAVINISMGGNFPDAVEGMLIKKHLDRSTVIVSSAGNDAGNLDVDCNYFPGCYDKRIVLVGSLDSRYKIAGKSQLAHFSNYAFKRESFYYVDYGIWTEADVESQGTSQSTAYVTGRIIKAILKQKELRKVQSFTSSDINTIQKAILASTDADEKIRAIAEKYIRSVPSEIKLAGGFIIPLYKTYSSGMFVIERRF